MEALQTHGPNILSFLLVMGEILWNAIRCYLAPHNASTLEHVVAATSQRPQGSELLVAGYFNADLAAPEVHDQDKTVAAEMKI